MSYHAAQSVLLAVAVITACKPQSTVSAEPVAVDAAPADFEGEIELKTRQVYSVKKDKARTGSTAGYGDITVIDGTKKKVYLVTPFNRTYFEMPFGGRASTLPKPVATKTGKSDRVAGYSCEDWEIVSPPLFKTVTCVTSELSVPVMTGSESPFRDAAGHPVMDVIGTQGFPLRTQMFDASGAPYLTLEVTRVERKSEPDADFEVPPGYTLRSEALQRRPNE